jgi:hypothetical protein
MTMIGKLRRKRFGEILVGDGLITKDQLQEALELQKSSGDFLGSILLELGHISETDIIKTLSIQYQLPFLRPSLYDVDRHLLQKFTPEFLHLHKLLPIDKIGNLLLVVVTDVPTGDVLAEIQQISGANLAIYIGSISEVDTILREAAPISEEEEDGVRCKRRGVEPKTAGAPSDDAEPDAEEELQEAEQEAELSADGDADPDVKKKTFTLDSSWESIFDQAEGKVKSDETEDEDGDGDGDGDGEQQHDTEEQEEQEHA